MTYHVRTRHGSHSILCDFVCPEHGRFEAMVIRVGGEAPDTSPCPECAATSPWSPSPIIGRVKRGEAIRGKSDERPPGFLNTEPLADGMDRAEWSKAIDKETHEMHRKLVRDKML